MQLQKASRFGGGGIASKSKEDLLREAAHLEISLGNIQHYCEILIQLGEWDKALATAPGVSMNYWKTLTQKRALALMAEDKDETVPYAVATGTLTCT